MPVASVAVKRSKKEFHSASVTPEVRPDVEIAPLGEPLEHEGDIILSDEGKLTKQYTDSLAFLEEPVKLIIHPSSSEEADNCTDLIAVNGVKAEMLINGAWVPVGFLPKNREIIVKRKYVGVMARAKKETVRLNAKYIPGEDPDNRPKFSTALRDQFSVLEDKNPIGQEWLTRCLRSRA